MNNGLNTNHIRSIVIDNNGSVFAGGDLGIWRSIDNGDSWQRINNGYNIIRNNCFYSCY